MITIRPPAPKKYGGGGKKLYTIHTGTNMIYSTLPSDIISVVGFKQKSQAQLVACMLEEYKRNNFSWPPMDEPYLPTCDECELKEAEISEWEPTELDNFCALNMLGLVTINDMQQTNAGYNFQGDSFGFTLTDELYRKILELKFNL